MSILRNTYDLCKTVKASPIRDKLQSLVHSLNRATDEQMQTGRHRAYFGLLSRQWGAQLLGYLLVDRDKERIAQNSAPFMRTACLSDEECHLVLVAHKQIDAINKRCLSELASSLLGFIPALDPYSNYGYDIPAETENIWLYDEPAAQILAEAFQAHPAVLLALKRYDSLYEAEPGTKELAVSVPEVVKGVLNLEQSLRSTGPLVVPRRLDELFWSQPVDSPDRILLDYMCALLCVRASLGVLDELLFQAVMVDRLPVLDEDNVIEVRDMVGTTVSTGFVVKYTPDTKSDFLYGHPGLVLVQAKVFDKVAGLCKAERISVQVSPDLGDTTEIAARIIDDNLNPYGTLLQHSGTPASSPRPLGAFSQRN